MKLTLCVCLIALCAFVGTIKPVYGQSSSLSEEIASAISEELQNFQISKRDDNSKPQDTKLLSGPDAKGDTETQNYPVTPAEIPIVEEVTIKDENATAPDENSGEKPREREERGLSIESSKEEATELSVKQEGTKQADEKSSMARRSSLDMHAPLRLVVSLGQQVRARGKGLRKQGHDMNRALLKELRRQRRCLGKCLIAVLRRLRSPGPLENALLERLKKGRHPKGRSRLMMPFQVVFDLGNRHKPSTYSPQAHLQPSYPTINYPPPPQNYPMPHATQTQTVTVPVPVALLVPSRPPLMAQKAPPVAYKLNKQPNGRPPAPRPQVPRPPVTRPQANRPKTNRPQVARPQAARPQAPRPQGLRPAGPRAAVQRPVALRPVARPAPRPY